MSFEEVKTLVLKLNLRERAALAQALLQTIEQPAKEEIAALWLEEAERRLDLVERGKTRIISGEEARQRVRKAVP